MKRQIALPLDELRPGASSSLILTPSNAHIAAALGRYGDWPGRCAILVGPARSGKSLFARYFKGQSGGIIVEDADSVGEEKLFNAWNRAQEEARALLLLSRFAPADWHIALPDLRSRLGAALLLQIAPPDDELVGHLIQKHLADRGTAIGTEALAYVTRRIDRSYSAIESFAREANAMALAEGGPVNLKRVKQILNGEER
ncbi:ATPase [Sphingorhabdus arenilitoris]|uniref:ATPase n=1 Tax=Sphingorhabdus arenilitoris TaxID=1490041 RepID=A0ABV8RG67_9SPHN